MTSIPEGLKARCKKTGKRIYLHEGRVYDKRGELVEWFEGKWCPVVNGARRGWWRFHEHYDRNGYCDNPGRGY